MDDKEECLTAISIKKRNNTPLNISFKNVSYSVECESNGKSIKELLYKSNNRTKKILDNVSGAFNSGRLTAILGPSGAGKSSLLRILSGCRTKGVKGAVLVNGSMRSMEEFRWQSSYIGQEAALLQQFTAQETLTFAADLKLSHKVTQRAKQQVIQDIAELLGLQKALDTRVSQLSGGEVKRLSIGVELVTNPPIMFFDEPTSGLDSVSSCQVISHLRLLAQGGRTVVCVIHQPSSRIFDMFDDLYVMANGCHVYGGPIKNMVQDFEEAKFTYPQYYNRADFALEVASGEIKGDLRKLSCKTITTNEDLRKAVTNTIGIVIEKAYTTPNGSNNLGESDTDYSSQFSIDDAKNDKRKRMNYPISQWRQFKILLKRSSVSTIRDLHLTKLRTAAHVFTGLVLGLIYYQIGNEASKITSNTAFLFFILLFVYFVNSMPTLLTFPREATVLKIEHLNNWYSLPAYFFSKLFADIPLQIICPTLFLLPVYYMTGQPCGDYRFLMVWLLTILFAIISQAFGLITGAATSAEMGTFLLPVITIPMLVFSGFFIHFDELPAYMRPLSYVSQFRYGFDALMHTTYGFNRSNLHCAADFCYFKSPTKYLEEFGMEDANYFEDMAVLVGVMLILQAALYVTLRVKLSYSNR